MLDESSVHNHTIYNSIVLSVFWFYINLRLHKELIYLIFINKPLYSQIGYHVYLHFWKGLLRPGFYLKSLFKLLITLSLKTKCATEIDKFLYRRFYMGSKNITEIYLQSIFQKLYVLGPFPIFFATLWIVSECKDIRGEWRIMRIIICGHFADRNTWLSCLDNRLPIWQL